MTIQKLHKLLTKAIADGLGRRKVCVQKDTFQHVLETDGVVILEVKTATVECVYQADDDGGIKILADGSGSIRTCLVLRGEDE